jgi:serine/threonine protein kinase
MENLANTIRLFQTGAMGRPEFLAQVDRLLASSPKGASSLLDALAREHARAPLPPEVYAEVEQRIAQAIEAHQRLGAEDTYVQTRPGDDQPAVERRGRGIRGQERPLSWPAAVAGTDGQGTPAPERMKGVGDTLNGRFVLEECIGFGGMGTVYKALDLRKLEASDRKPYIAIKVLNVQFQGHPKSLIALQREARKAQSLAHPNIVSVYDFDRDGSMVYLTMEYLEGRPLSQVLRAPNFRGMPFDEAIKIVTGMGKALAYAHERGFVHCDFKPANVIQTESGVVKVIDFGIARVFQKAEEDSDVTVFDPGSLGALTPAYASPEMLENREPDPRDDIYALGCITYELLTGRHPFNRLSATQARDAGMRPQRPPKLHHQQWRALRCALALERDARTPSVNRYLAEIGYRNPLMRPAVMKGAAAAGVAVLALLAVFFLRGRQAPGPQPEPTGAAQAPAQQMPPPIDPRERAVQTAPAPAVPAPAAPAPAEVAPAPTRPTPSPPPPTLAAVTAALAGVPCAALAPAVHDRTVRVEGYLPRRYGQARLRSLLTALPGVSGVDLALQEVDDNKCGLLGVLGRYWVAHRMAGVGASIRLDPASGKGASQLVEGDTLMVDVTTPNFESYVTVDYFVLDGSVVHLLPNLRARENLAPARYTATVGSLGNWVIGKPFGNELVVMIATPVPPFGALRPESESATDYLRALDRQLAQISKARGPGAVAVDFLQISTRGKVPEKK